MESNGIEFNSINKYIKFESSELWTRIVPFDPFNLQVNEMFFFSFSKTVCDKTKE